MSIVSGTNPSYFQQSLSSVMCKPIPTPPPTQATRLMQPIFAAASPTPIGAQPDVKERLAVGTQKGGWVDLSARGNPSTIDVAPARLEEDNKEWSVLSNVAASKESLPSFGGPTELTFPAAATTTPATLVTTANTSNTLAGSVLKAPNPIVANLPQTNLTNLANQLKQKVPITYEYLNYYVAAILDGRISKELQKRVLELDSKVYSGLTKEFMLRFLTVAWIWEVITAKKTNSVPKKEAPELLRIEVLANVTGVQKKWDVHPQLQTLALSFKSLDLNLLYLLITNQEAKLDILHQNALQTINTIVSSIEISKDVLEGFKILILSMHDSVRQRFQAYKANIEAQEKNRKQAQAMAPQHKGTLHNTQSSKDIFLAKVEAMREVTKALFKALDTIPITDRAICLERLDAFCVDVSTDIGAEQLNLLSLKK